MRIFIYTQGETIQSTQEILSCILNTGKYFYSSENGQSSVEIKLIFNPYYEECKGSLSSCVCFWILHHILYKNYY